MVEEYTIASKILRVYHRRLKNISRTLEILDGKDESANNSPGVKTFLEYFSTGQKS